MTIAVLMGGPSLERPISMLSGAEVLRDLVGRGRHAIPLVLDPAALMRVASPPAGIAELEALLANPEPTGDSGWGPPRSMPETAEFLRAQGVRCVFVALHGSPGEDGSLQAWLEWSGLPHTSSSPMSSALALDKTAFKALLEKAGLPTPSWLLFTRDQLRSKEHRTRARDRVEQTLAYPVVVKATDQGSSFGVHVVRGPEELERAFDECSSLAHRVLVESFVAGRELTCAVIGGEGSEDLETLPVVEIVPRAAAWFDFDSKYSDGGADEIVPADIPEVLAEEIRRLALASHRLIEAHGLTRTDFMVSESGPQILEINTIPGMTRASLTPKAAEAGGLGFSGLVDRMIELGVGRGRRWAGDSL
jgi:D-alanine-D-alanine ligase